MLIWSPMAIMFNNHFYTLKTVSGRSMQPTLNPDSSTSRDTVVFDRFSIRLSGQLARGDIVVFPSPLDPSRMLIKRVLAQEGDTVSTLPPYPAAEVQIPFGHVWVEGDEPFRSSDSNSFGPLPLALIDSKLLFIVFPFSRWGSLAVSSPDRLPHGPIKRLQEAAVERERWRRSRVRLAPGNN